MEDIFTVNHSDHCTVDTLTLDFSLSNLGEIDYIIDSGTSNTIPVTYTQLVLGCATYATLEFFNTSSYNWKTFREATSTAAATHDFVSYFDRTNGDLTISTSDFATYSSDPDYQAFARVTVTSTSSQAVNNIVQDTFTVNFVDECRLINISQYLSLVTTYTSASPLQLVINTAHNNE